MKNSQEMVASLTPREMAVLRMRFGLSEDDPSEDVGGWPLLFSRHNSGSGGSSAPAISLDPIVH